MPRFFSLFLDVFARLRRKRVLEHFFALPEAERSEIIRGIYRHSAMRERYEAFFQVRYDYATNSQFVFDLCAGYGKVLPDSCIRQIGCFALTESRFLLDAGFEGRLQASDFDAERLNFLESHKIEIGCERVELLKQDISESSPSDYAGVDCVVCQAVLSNIQPGDVRRAIQAMKSAGVSMILIGDCYSKESMDTRPGRPSMPSPVDRNWFHPYLSIAAETGYEGIFFPDFSYTSFHIARGIFILHLKDAPIDHEMAFSNAFASYLRRQGKVLSTYNKTNINAPMAFE